MPTTASTNALLPAAKLAAHSGATSFCGRHRCRRSSERSDEYGAPAGRRKIAPGDSARWMALAQRPRSLSCNHAPLQPPRPEAAPDTVGDQGRSTPRDHSAAFRLRALHRAAAAAVSPGQPRILYTIETSDPAEATLFPARTTTGRACVYVFEYVYAFEYV